MFEEVLLIKSIIIITVGIIFFYFILVSLFYAFNYY